MKPRPSELPNRSASNLLTQLAVYLTVTMLVLTTFASANTVGRNHLKTDAIRLDVNQRIPGMILDISDDDDDADLVTLPFPVNFFGTKYEYGCATSNGGASFTNDTDEDNCPDVYDYSVAATALATVSPYIGSGPHPGDGNELG